tara:strand:+ start:6762 stop:6893 length:132 start_codon:yes stop_codon:yes gene_type:complete
MSEEDFWKKVEQYMGKSIAEEIKSGEIWKEKKKQTKKGLSAWF